MTQSVAEMQIGGDKYTDWVSGVIARAMCYMTAHSTSTEQQLARSQQAAFSPSVVLACGVESVPGPSQKHMKEKKQQRHPYQGLHHSQALCAHSENVLAAIVGTSACSSPSRLRAACLQVCPALKRPEGAPAIREEAYRWNSISELLRKLSITDLILYTSLNRLDHQGSKHTIQRAKTKGKESKLTEKPDSEIITNSQLSVPMEDLRHKNPQNYLQPALKMFWFLPPKKTDTPPKKNATQTDIKINFYSLRIYAQKPNSGLSSESKIYPALGKLTLSCLNFPIY